jgi:hypothetical protein
MSRTLAALALCLLATGCATVVNGPSQTLEVDSHPTGAALQVDCGEGVRDAGTTPAKVKVSRAADHCRLTFTRQGYEPRVIELEHQESRATVLNAAFGLPSAVVLGIVGALAGSLVDEWEAGAMVGGEAGWHIGRGGVTALDKKGGGWKWVPGRVFAYLSKPENPEPAN